MKFCTSCGAAAGQDLRFCTTCGATLSLPGPADLPPAVLPLPERRPAPPDSRSSPLPVLVFAVLAALSLAGVGYAVLDGGLLDGNPAAGGDRPSPARPVATPTRGADTSRPTPTGVAATESAAPASQVLRPESVTASCQAPAGQDSVGATVTYEPERTLDGRGETAWRCPGSAVGERLTYDFGRPVTLVSVALVPGYDKIDDTDGLDRFTENRTVTAVTWRFDDGATHRQDIGVPQRTLTVSSLATPVRTTRVVLEISGTGNNGARRDFTPISDVGFVGS